MDRKFFKHTLLSTFVILFIIGSFNFIIDPFFYFHKPLEKLNYNLDYFDYNTFEKNVKLTGTYQRYTNYRISQIYETEAIIIGTSMTENFRASLIKKYFNKLAIKLPYSGASYFEINNELSKILKKNKKLNFIIRGLDYGKILNVKNSGAYIPKYLVENKLLSRNTFEYLFNIKILRRGVDILYNTYKQGKREFNFDTYSNWGKQVKYGKKYILEGQNSVLLPYKRLDKKIYNKMLNEKEISIIKENVQANVLSLPKKYPEKKFVYFIPPYSIVYWDFINQNGEILKQLEAEEIMIKMILEVPNIELFSFLDNYNLVINLDSYRDPVHYIYKINDKILEWISQGKYRLTKDNYQEYLEKNKNFYLNYNYEDIFKN